MAYTLERVHRLVGQLRVPGELAPAQRQVLLAALAQGESRVGNTPVGVERLLQVLRQLGANVERTERTVHARAAGMLALQPPAEALDLRQLGPIRQTLLGVLAAQPHPTRVLWGSVDEGAERLLRCLQAMGARVDQQDAALTVGGGAGLSGTRHDATRLAWEGRLGLLLAGLTARGTTVLLEAEAHRSRVERALRTRRVPVECRREEATGHFRVAVTGRRTLAALDVTLGGDLTLAYPFMIIALARRRSQLVLREVRVHPASRGLLDLLRQISDSISLAGVDGDLADITVAYGKRLRATRLAGQRATRISRQMALVAVLATQCSGEFVIRNVPEQPAGATDRVAHLRAMLKNLGAHVGEYEQGLVIQGGIPLGGCRLDCLQDADLALAAITAGALAHGQTSLANAECLNQVYPDFLTALDSVRE